MTSKPQEPAQDAQPQPRVELTEIGEQYVIPGCERRYEPGKPKQIGLWE